MRLYVWWLKLRLAHAKRWHANGLRLWKAGRIKYSQATSKAGEIAKLEEALRKENP